MKGTKNNKKVPPSKPSKFAMPGVDIAQLEGLLEFMAAHGLEEFEYEHGGLHIRLKKAAAEPGRGPRPLAAASPAAQTSPVPPPAPSSPESKHTAVEKPQAPESEELHVIKSPIVGTFYSSSGPDAAPFVQVGDAVQSGQVVCIVEAMKLMNEIEADVTGEIVRVLVENGQPVEYGQGLFAIRAARKKK